MEGSKWRQRAFEEWKVCLVVSDKLRFLSFGPAGRSSSTDRLTVPSFPGRSMATKGLLFSNNKRIRR